MRIRSNPYIMILVYELLRLFTLLKQGAVTFSGALPITWYASVGLLILTPVIILILMVDEQNYSSWLPVVSIIKGIQILSLILFCFQSWPQALRFALAGDQTLLKPILSSVVFIFADTYLMWYCLRRRKKLCK